MQPRNNVEFRTEWDACDGGRFPVLSIMMIG